MGSGFIAYASIMAIILLVGEAWVRRSGRSPEWWDSWYVTFLRCMLVLTFLYDRVIMLWVSSPTQLVFIDV